MQGIYGRCHSKLLQALNNAADGSLRLARRVKSNKIKWFSSIKHDPNFLLIFMQDLGIYSNGP